MVRGWHRRGCCEMTTFAPRASYGPAFRRRVRAMGIKEVVTAPRSPSQNPYVERLIGSIRRACLDHIIIFNEHRLRDVLLRYFEYHHKARTHLSLNRDCPRPHRIQPTFAGRIIAFPGGWWSASSLRTSRRVSYCGDRTVRPVSAWRGRSLLLSRSKIKRHDL
jgi:hypothetical protein